MDAQLPEKGISFRTRPGGTEEAKGRAKAIPHSSFLRPSGASRLLMSFTTGRTTPKCGVVLPVATFRRPSGASRVQSALVEMRPNP
jgi:hypothetical protein